MNGYLCAGMEFKENIDPLTGLYSPSARPDTRRPKTKRIPLLDVTDQYVPRQKQSFGASALPPVPSLSKPRLNALKSLR
ncbi:hypothetical protein QOT17_012410 [Balamuthia mandrillaris]